MLSLVWFGYQHEALPNMCPYSLSTATVHHM